jgi:hypothetical protein
VKQFKSILRRCLAVLVIRHQAATVIGGQNLRRLEMLARERALARIELPPRRNQPANPLAHRRRPAPDQRPLSWEPLPPALGALGPIQLRQVRRTPEERLFDGLVERYHYLAYTQPVGEHLKYLAFAQNTPVACLAWSSPPRHLEPRDKFIGWTVQQRCRHLHLLAYNSRYLILPWARVPHLASHLLARMAGVLCSDWQRLYAHPIYWLETFIDPARFASTCYRAATYQLVESLLRTLAWVMGVIQTQKASWGRLRRMLFGAQTEKTANLFPATAAAENTSATPPAGPKAKRKGHGRNGADDYPGAQRVSVLHPKANYSTMTTRTCGCRACDRKSPTVTTRTRGPKSWPRWASTRWRCFSPAKSMRARIWTNCLRAGLPNFPRRCKCATRWHATNPKPLELPKDTARSASEPFCRQSRLLPYDPVSV